MDPFSIRTKTYKNGTQVMSHPHKKGPDQRPSRGNGIIIPVMDRIILLWAACMAKKMIISGANYGELTSINLLNYINENKDKEPIILINMGILMGNSEKSFIFKTKWFNEKIYKIGNGQAWRCRWERLCGKRYNNNKSKVHNKNNTHVIIKDKLKTDDLSKIIPVCEEKDHPLEKFNDFTFEDMWNFIY